MPRVSVIIPNYNHCKFLRARLESVFGQTFQDFEVIFLDDASTDDSRAVFEQISQPHKDRVTAVFNDTNSGNPFKQWNKGARLAKGEYLWIAESDDYADPNFLAELVSVLDRNPSVGLGYCRSTFIDEFENTEEWIFDGLWTQNFIQKGKEEFINHLLKHNPIPNASAVLIRKSAFEAAGYADETMSYCGDWATWVKVALISDIGFSAQPLSYFRKHQATVSARVDQTLVAVHERYRVIELILQHIAPDQELLETVWDSMARDWVSRTFNAGPRETWRRSLSIYEIATKVDPRLLSRLTTRVLGLLLGKIGVLKVRDQFKTQSRLHPTA